MCHRILGGHEDGEVSKTHRENDLLLIIAIRKYLRRFGGLEQRDTEIVGIETAHLLCFFVRSLFDRCPVNDETSWCYPRMDSILMIGAVLGVVTSCACVGLVVTCCFTSRMVRDDSESHLKCSRVSVTVSFRRDRDVAWSNRSLSPFLSSFRPNSSPNATSPAVSGCSLSIGRSEILPIPEKRSPDAEFSAPSLNSVKGNYHSV